MTSTHMLFEIEEDEYRSLSLPCLGVPTQSGMDQFTRTMSEAVVAQGGRTLLSGFGGDEGVSAPVSRALVAEMVARRRLLGSLGAQFGHPVRGLQQLAAQWRAELGYGQTHRTWTGDLEIRASILGQDVVQIPEVAQAYASTRATWAWRGESVNARVIKRLQGAHVSNRTVECSLVAAKLGVEMSWPLLDARLIQQYLSTPAIEKANFRRDRLLMRRSVADLLPGKVVWRRGKNMGAYIRDYPASGIQRAVAARVERVMEEAPGVLLDLVDAGKLRQAAKLSTQGDALLIRQVRNLDRARAWLAWLDALPPSPSLR